MFDFLFGWLHIGSWPLWAQIAGGTGSLGGAFALLLLALRDREKSGAAANAAYLKQLRVERGLSLADMSVRLGVTLGEYLRIENAQEEVEPYVARELAEILDTDEELIILSNHKARAALASARMPQRRSPAMPESVRDIMEKAHQERQRAEGRGETAAARDWEMLAAQLASLPYTSDEASERAHRFAARAMEDAHGLASLMEEEAEHQRTMATRGISTPRGRLAGFRQRESVLEHVRAAQDARRRAWGEERRVGAGNECLTEQEQVKLFRASAGWPRRDGAKAPSKERERSAPDAEDRSSLLDRKWRAAKTWYDETAFAYGNFYAHPQDMLKRARLDDTSAPETRAFIEVFMKATALNTDALPPESMVLEFHDLAIAAKLAWQEAEAAAKAWYAETATRPERASFRKAEHALSIAFDPSASVPERRRAMELVHDMLKKLRLSVPERVEQQFKIEIEAAQPKREIAR